MKNIQNSWKQATIGLALFILIPTTASLGLKIISPKIDNESYLKARASFFGNYKHYDDTEKGYEIGKQQEDLWEKTETFIAHHKSLQTNQLIALIFFSSLSIILFYISATFTLPIIAASLMLSGLWLNLVGNFDNSLLLARTNILIMVALFKLLALLVVLWAARRNLRQ
ncbi:MAG: hypothetical protein NTZ68_02985 [Candidatus Dependentiae bacterium]|nr:hypothetical protein [Candidatus Dependentiae bacterium]